MYFVVRSKIVAGDFLAGSDFPLRFQTAVFPVDIRVWIAAMIEERVRVVGPFNVFIIIDLNGKSGWMIEKRTVIREKDIAQIDVG